MFAFSEDFHKGQLAGTGEGAAAALHAAPYEPFVCRDFKVLPDGRMLPQIAFFTEKYPFPAVLENGREWMTLQPNEMVTTWPAIAKAKGRVLTFGMGLGYFTYHAAEKPEVESVINFIGLVLLLGLAVIIAIKDIIML